MAYCTSIDIQALVLIDTLVRLTDDSNSNVVDESKVSACILTADEIINAFLRNRYTVPLSVVPNLLLTLSRDLAVYELYSRRGEGGIPDHIKARAENARKMLLQIQRGELDLGLTAPDARLASTIQVNKEDSDRLFSKEVLDGY